MKNVQFRSLYIYALQRCYLLFQRQVSTQKDTVSTLPLSFSLSLERVGARRNSDVAKWSRVSLQILHFITFNFTTL